MTSKLPINLKNLLRRSRPLRRGTGLVALSQSFHDGRAEAETGLRKTTEGVLEIDQSHTGRITQQACGTDDAQAEGLGNLAAAFFIHDRQAGIAMLPGEGDRGSLSGIEGVGFFQERSDIRQNHNPRRRMLEKLPQRLGCPWMASLLVDGGGDGDRAVESVEQFQFSQLRQTGKRGVIADDDHGKRRGKRRGRRRGKLPRKLPRKSSR